MITRFILPVFFLITLCPITLAQTADPSKQKADKTLHAVLPTDGVIEYLPHDTSHLQGEQDRPVTGVMFKPLVNFFFRPESTIHYKEAGMREDTGQYNFYLRGDFGGRISLPENIDVVFNLQSYGVYTRSFGPLDQNMSLYEAYVDMKNLDRQKRLSLRFGRMSLGKYGNEILVGDDDFVRGRSFESVRLRFHTSRVTSDLMWVQLYQAAPDSAGFEWNHPLFLGSFNTFRFHQGANLDIHLPYLLDQFNTGINTSVIMPDVRFYGQSSSIRYSAEFIYQSGAGKGILNKDIKGKVNAYAAELGIGYFSDDKKLAVDLSYYRASGDDQPGDEKIKSFNVLWQNNHRRFGHIDAFKGSNVQAVTLHLNWQLGRFLATGVHGVYAGVIEPGDRSTGVATIPSLSNLETSSKSLGFGGDWYLNYYYNHYLSMQFSASVFSPGDYFTAVNGIDQPMVRMYLLLALKL